MFDDKEKKWLIAVSAQRILVSAHRKMTLVFLWFNFCTLYVLTINVHVHCSVPFQLSSRLRVFFLPFFAAASALRQIEWYRHSNFSWTTIIGSIILNIVCWKHVKLPSWLLFPHSKNTHNDDASIGHSSIQLNIERRSARSVTPWLTLSQSWMLFVRGCSIASHVGLYSRKHGSLQNACVVVLWIIWLPRWMGDDAY